MPAAGMDEVIAQLTALVDEARAQKHRRGYFAALYLGMSRSVQQAIAAGQFDDSSRMDRFAGVFASRYLDALAAYRAGSAAVAPPTRSWRIAFAACERKDLLILQHVILGINAHVNLDLGVAAATVAPGVALAGIKADFDRINAIIGGRINTVQAEIGRFSPLLDLLWKVGQSADDEVLNFSFHVARDEAWQHAMLLAPMAADSPQRAATVDSFDRAASVLGKLVVDPGGLLGTVVSVVHHTESDDVVGVIDALAS